MATVNTARKQIVKKPKSSRPKKVLRIYKDVVGGFVSHYKLLKESLAKVETVTVTLSDFQIEGFAQRHFMVH